MTEPTSANLRAEAVVDRRRANWPNARNTGRMAGYLPVLKKGGMQRMNEWEKAYYNKAMRQMGWSEKTEK